MSYTLLAYNQSLALLTDFYQLTMTYGYWKTGVDKKETVFHLFFRENPFKGGFAITCGLSYVIDFLENFQFDQTDVDYLSSLKGNDGKLLFEKNFLTSLMKMEFRCDVDAIPEGTLVFPYEPLVRVQGPIIQCQLLETTLLNMMNYQTLIATKAARVSMAAQGEPVLEFGLRRAQGIDGSLAASRAAYIGGCQATSNVLAGKMFGIPVKGTHAHSWIMSFDDELEAFQAYAKALPNNCVFLVDTYDTLQGVKKAAEVGKWLRQQGHEMLGVRLDSGDLASLSIETRKILDEEGFPDAKIIASNELDERLIEELKAKGAKIAIWGVGTKLITGYDQPALGGVYKLSAVRAPTGDWKYKIKLSEQELKISNPGIQQVRRYTSEGKNFSDVIFDIRNEPAGDCVAVDMQDGVTQTKIPEGTPFTDLLVPIFRHGKRVYHLPSIHEVKEYAQTNLSRLHPGVKRLTHPDRYSVGIEKSLYELKTELIRQTRAMTI